MRSTNASYGRLPQRLVEMLDDRHLDARGGQPFEPFAGVEQERRGGAPQDLVRVVIEGDDRRLGAARPGLGDEMLEEVGVAEVHPVEHADDDEDRDRASGRSPSIPSTTCIPGSAHRRRPRVRRDEDLVGREAAARGRGDGDQRPAGVAQAIVLGRARAGRRPDGRTGRGRRPRPRPAVSVTTGNASSPVSIGRSTGRRPSGLSAAAARTSSSGTAVSSVNGPDAVRVSAPR